MTLPNTDPFYFTDEDKPNYSVARATALEVMGTARRYDEYIRVNGVNEYYSKGTRHFKMSGQPISRNDMLVALKEDLIGGATISISDLSWSI